MKALPWIIFAIVMALLFAVILNPTPHTSGYKTEIH